MLLLGLFVVASATCSSLWGQCGGLYWSGPQCCDSSSSCVYSNPWYSQCLPATPTPAPTPLSPHPTPSTLPMFCPSASDLVLAYGGGTTTIDKQGWTTTGSGAVATKASFNVLGGWVNYTLDVSKALVGVNSNIYSISPSSIPSTGFTQTNYCDGAKTGSDWCIEIDWIESNGNCGGATTYHTIEGTGVGCTAWGCSTSYAYYSQTLFNMSFYYSPSGVITAYRNNQPLAPVQPTPPSSVWQIIQQAYTAQGAVIYSSQWTGWVPTISGCSTGNGNLAGSTYKISNLRIQGHVVQGPIPTKC